MLLSVLLFRNKRVFTAGNLTLSFSFHRLPASLFSADRDDRQLSLEIRSITGRTARRITRTHERFEQMTAAAAFEIVKRHELSLRQTVTFSDDKLYA